MKYSRRQFMERTALGGLAMAALPRTSLLARSAAGPYEPTWDSLSRYQVPEWYDDAKFGIFLHWGIYSVPAHANEWYPRNMYRKESPVFAWHREHWGPQSMFGYKDFIPLFRGEFWNPDQWVELFRRTGARYVVPVGEHHDGFPMYDCIFTRWNALRMGPHRDVVGELSRALRNQGLRFGVSSHRAFHWSYYTYEKDFDTSNPLYAGLYGPIHAPAPWATNQKGELRQRTSEAFRQDWYARTVNLVDRYRPDLIYFDWGFGAPEFEPYRKQFAAYYYNQAEKWGRGVAIDYKQQAYPEDAAVLEIERGVLDHIRPRLWQTGTSIGWKSWGYIRDEDYKTAHEIIPELVDIVSKHGCLLLNVGPKPDGTFPEEAEKALHNIGRWMEVNGEAIYSTRPWKIYGEGPTRLPSGSFAEKVQKFTGQDVRFTTRPGALYAICLAWPGKELRLTSLGSQSGVTAERIADLRLLGSDQKLAWHQSPEALTVTIPGPQAGEYAFTFKLALKA